MCKEPAKSFSSFHIFIVTCQLSPLMRRNSNFKRVWKLLLIDALMEACVFAVWIVNTTCQEVEASGGFLQLKILVTCQG